MTIHEMSIEECHRVLAGAKFARLGCASENQPYVVPVSLAFDEKSKCFYGFTTPGQKVEWMRANPLVCVEVDEIVSYDQWVSVIVTGRYEELPETPSSEDARLWAPGRPRLVDEVMPRSADSQQCQSNDDRQQAWQALQSQAMWWEPGQTAWAARAHRATGEPFASVFYRIRIEQITGHKATRNASNAISIDAPTAPPACRWRRLLGALTRIFAGASKTEHGDPAPRIRR